MRTKYEQFTASFFEHVIKSRVIDVAHFYSRCSTESGDMQKINSHKHRVVGAVLLTTPCCPTRVSVSWEALAAA